MKELIAIAFSLLLLSCSQPGVNLFMGTAGDHGQVSPAAQVPFGLVSVGPDSDPPSHPGYDYDVPAVSGISVTRMSGVGGEGTGGNLRVRPALPGQPLQRVAGSEKAQPGYYEVLFDNGVKASLTATRHCALERYSFPADGPSVLSVDVSSFLGRGPRAYEYEIADNQTLTGWFQGPTTGNRGSYKLFFCLQCDRPFTVLSRDGEGAVLEFQGREAEVRVGLSSIDEASAAAEVAALEGRSFNRLKKEAAGAWNRIFSKAEVKGGSREDRILFYTSLYRLCQSPFDATFGGVYRGNDGKVGEADGWTFYSGWSIWDTFRTKFPLLVLLEPEVSADICRSLVALFGQDKHDWASACEPVPTTRTEHSQILLLDAWRKGIRGFDLAQAFPSMESEELAVRSPDQRMETAYDLWALSQIAGIIGQEEKAAHYAAESVDLFRDTWQQEFMTVTDDFVQMRRNGLYQGTRWQYRWAVPVYLDSMCAWHGKERLADELEEFFARHLFNQGNEPDIQTPFMFPLLGRPQKTDSLVCALLTDDAMPHLYGGNAEYPQPFVGRAFRNAPDGYAPEMDEDDGTMSAWLLFAQLGLYPVCVGTDSYQLFSPLFQQVTLHLPSGPLQIERTCPHGRAKAVYADGERLEDFSISHERLLRTRKLVFSE